MFHEHRIASKGESFQDSQSEQAQRPAAGGSIRRRTLPRGGKDVTDSFGTRLATGVILCGGAGRRVGGADKPLLPWRGRALIDHVVERLQPQVKTLRISANRNLDAYRQRAPVIADRWPDFQGPLAGIASVLQSARAGDPAAAPRTYLVCPGDTPYLPADLGARLASGRPPGSVRYAHDGQRAQPLCLYCDDSVLGGLLDYLHGGRRSVMGWLEACGAVPVHFADVRAFTNLNSSAALLDEG